jgi:hypothetical protein
MRIADVKAAILKTDSIFVGPDIPLSCDASNGYSVSTAIRQGRWFGGS